MRWFLPLFLSVILFPKAALAQTTDLPIVGIRAPETVFAEFYAPYTYISLYRFGDLSEPLEVKYVISGEARNGVDYGRLSGSVTIPADEYTWPLVINATDDAETEDPESLEVSLITTISPFTLVILPDTQFYTTKVYGSFGGTPGMFTQQTQWIIDNKTQTNIAFVMHEGDCTQDNLEIEWQRARGSMSLLDGVVPYAVAVGNHDGLVNKMNDTTLFNKYFSVTNYEDSPSFGGVFEAGHMDNSYHFFSAGGLDWLVLSLEFGPRDEVLAWANTVVSNHPDRRVILVTHTHVYTDNTLHGTFRYHGAKPTDYGRENDGTHVWQKLIRHHPNFAFVFNGHVHENGNGQGRLVKIGDHGNKVFQMLCNYQFNANGGAGLLRYVTFYPEEDRFEAKSFSPVLNRFITDPANEFEYRDLGIFTNITPTYTIDPERSAVAIEILSDEIDTTPPTLVSVSAAGNPAEISVVFNEPLDQLTAETITNYSINNPIPITNASLASDLKTVVLTCNSSLTPMATYTLTVIGVKDRTFQSNEITTLISKPFFYWPVLLDDDFSDSSMEEWTVVDEGEIGFPSIWSIVNGKLLQYSDIQGFGLSSTNNSRRGTFVRLNKPLSLNWKDYAASVTLNNADDDGIGLMFRYQNRSNYYKVDFDAQRAFRRLSKVINGVETELAREDVPFQVNRDVHLRITAYGNQLTTTLNGSVLFGGPITDNSLTNGTIALFSWGSTGAKFDNVVVTLQNSVPQVEIVSPQSDAIFSHGTPVQFEITAADSEGVAVVELFHGNTRLAVLTNAPYRFTWFNPPPGHYNMTARATDIFDTIGNSAPRHLQIGAALPVFLQQPQDQAISIGHSALFRARVSGTPPLTYQWMFNGEPLIGATTRLLYINNVTEFDAGAYTLRVSSPAATVTSDPAYLNLISGSGATPTNTTPVLTLIENEIGQQTVFSVTAPLGIIEVQVSTNLHIWNRLETTTNLAGRFYSGDTNFTSASRYFRAMITP